MSTFGEDDSGANFDETEIAALVSRRAPNNQVTPDTAEALAAERLKQDNGRRATLVTWTTWIVAATLLGNGGIFITYLVSQWGNVSDAVMIAWLSATVVEVLGLAYIITSDLFKDGSPRR